ncbi:MAG: sulfur carrier protein ThiS [Tannerella sp.]|jgi:sulfur carrier protein|nr:sulfur carrier protein ThiS [Tannerella sp.]
MKIKLNDKPYSLADGTTLDKFMRELGMPLQGVAIAIDYEVVPKSRWEETVLEDGLELMMIHAVSGG